MSTQYTARISREFKSELQEFISEKFDGNNQLFLEQSLKTLKTKLPEFSDSELGEIKEALDFRRESFEEFTKMSVMAMVKRTLTSKENNEKEDNQKTTRLGAGESRIIWVIETLIEHNNGCEQKEDKFYLTPSFIAQVSQANLNGVKRVMDKGYQQKLDDSNETHQLELRDNSRDGRNAKVDAQSAIGFFHKYPNFQK